jgi:hypothetical protein
MGDLIDEARSGVREDFVFLLIHGLKRGRTYDSRPMTSQMRWVSFRVLLLFT